MKGSFIKFLKQEKRLSNHTVISYEADLNQFISFFSEYSSKKEIESADKRAIRSWIVELSLKNLSPKSINRKIATLKSFYKFLVKREIIKINPKNKKIVEKVNISGNTVTDESVIRSELLIDEGDPINLLKLDQSIAKIKSRNIFGDVQSKIIDGSNDNQKIINISVEEKPTGEITAGAGIGTDGGSFAFSITENNWLGKGINVATSFDISSETFSGGLSVTDPNFNFSGNTVSYFLQNIKNDKPDSGYKNDIITTGIETSFEQYKDIYLSPSLSFSYDKPFLVNLFIVWKVLLRSET